MSCTIATLFADYSASFTLVVKVNPSTFDGATITNTAEVFSNTTDTFLTNNEAVAMTAVGALADLAVTKSDAPDPVTAGADITYTITLDNAGPSHAQNVVLSDTIPANTTFVSFTQDSGPTFILTTLSIGGTGAATAMIATFAAGASASFTLVVNANATTQNGTTIMTTAPIASTTTDSDPANNTATETTTVSEAADPDLSVPLSDSPDPVSAGANITYTIRVDNAGPATAAHVVLDDPLPARTTFGSLRAAAAGPARRRPRAAWGRCHAEPHHSPMARPRPSLLWCVSIPPRWRAPLSRTRRL